MKKFIEWIPAFAGMTRKQIISIVTIIILLIAIPVTLYLVKQQQTLKSKATENIYNGFEVTGPDGSPLPTRELNGQRIYDTGSLNVTIRIRDLNSLLNFP